MGNNMKKILYILWLCLLSSQVAFAGDFVIGRLKKELPEYKNAPLKICYNSKHSDYYPSRIFDIDHREGKYIVYNLHVVYLDSCSTPKLKTVKVKIPKEFKGIRCHVDSKELVYVFFAKNREIDVSVPAIEKDTLGKYAYSNLYKYPLENPIIYKLIYMREKESKDNRYFGIRQSASYTLFYYNFTLRQRNRYEDVLNSFVM